MECIILAGGLGTRLQGTIGAQPKCMAPINGLPFLHYIFEYLTGQRCTRVIVSLGYKYNIVVKWLEEQDLYFELDYVVESEPLGTGGGILAAIEEAVTDHVVVLNGDTFFNADLSALMKFHAQNNAATTLALKKMTDFERYGIVHTENNGLITRFEEKKPTTTGLINGGIYVINRELFLNQNLPEKFSFEKDYLEKFAQQGAFYGMEVDGYFIDIGVPEDYALAQTDFKKMFP